MQKHLRKPLIAANWKMNKTVAEAAKFVDDLLLALGKNCDVQVLLCPPFTALESVARKIEGLAIYLGAQNMHPEKSGAFTGEISAQMLRQLFVSFVIIGHSERRRLFAESDEFIAQKVKTACESKLRPILCIGETLEERSDGRVHEVLERQLAIGLQSVSQKIADTVVIAYEPVWAIGTGQAATPEMAQAAHGAIRAWLTQRFGEVAAQRMRIIYGGSMTPENVESLLSEPDIDGALVGGSGLEVRSLMKLVDAARD